ncbi:hypothetical protein GALMADRAFT_229583 [Galerina marginata CBS 339.88]|uniref:Laccase n=1 Tax=Galerina marginata (strain CBS 339.88) TaxID=685588 RepID=A0A067SL00_GALM3|nr:hypothetical protein GALMADRAFT_229583 [Galerina marginata CBS 339.88]
MLSIASIVGLSYAAGAFAAIGPSADLVIANQYITPDGFNRSAVLAGTSQSSLQFPGPLITGKKGDTFRLNVIDQLTDTSMLMSTSIHWHGFFQAGSSWADGPAGITQCPISPGHSFLYEFSNPDQAGTYWYHSHHQTQYCDGLRGPMVVYDPADPHASKYDFDDESTIITLADWYHFTAPQAPSIPVSTATLINGLGRYVNGAASPLAVIKVLPNKRYRFRLISLSCDPNFTFSIDGHNLTIIEVDGVNTQPLVVDSIQIFAGQRYSFILNTMLEPSNYWIRALPNAGPPGFNGGLNSAILRYIGALEIDPNTTLSLSNPMLETNLHPLSDPSTPPSDILGPADVKIQLNISFNSTAHHFLVNNASFAPPNVPVLLQILSGAYQPQDLLPTGSVYVLDPGKVVELTMPGGAPGSPHPIHLHGHNFAVVRSAGSSVYNYHDPVIRDVVSLGGSNDSVTIRFKTDNSGPWILHCHIDWHLEAGLAVVFAENITGVASNSHPPAWDQLCPIYNASPPQVFN